MGFTYDFLGTHKSHTLETGTKRKREASGRSRGGEVIVARGERGGQGGRTPPCLRRSQVWVPICNCFKICIRLGPDGSLNCTLFTKYAGMIDRGCPELYFCSKYAGITDNLYLGYDG